MDDIGNLLYIAVFIIWFLYRLFGKGGKKPARPMPPFDPSAPPPEPMEDIPSEPRSKRPSTPPITFEDILRELTGAPQSEPQTTETYEHLPEVEPLSHEVEETSFEVMETPEPSAKRSQIVDQGKFKEFEIHKERSSKAARAAFKLMRSKQGARQAFIMKEIFDRKY